MTTNTTHVFLRDIPQNERQARIAALPEWRKTQIVARHFPGVDRSRSEVFETALAAAKREVTEQSLFLADGTKVRGHKAVVHPSYKQPAGVVGRGFGVIQHGDAIKAIESLGDLCSLESIHLWENGARFDATALIGFSQIQQLGREKDDALAQFIRVSNRHDGSGQYRIGLYTLRLICLNGACSVDTQHAVTIRHTRNAADYAGVAHEAIDQLVRAAKADAEQLEVLAQSKLALDEFIELAETILTEVRGEADTDRKKERRVNDVTDLTELFLHGDGNVGQSKYDAENAFTQWITPRREQYEDAAKFARKFRAHEEGLGANIRRRVRAKLLA